MTPLIGYLVAVLATIALEFPVYWAFQRKRPLALLEVCAAINLATVPMANLAYSYAPEYLPLIEAVVVLVETPPIHWLLPQSYGRALLISVVANGLSALVGLTLWLV